MAAEQVIGRADGSFCLTADELFALADLARKVESLGIVDDATFKVQIVGEPWEIRCGWDETGTCGILAASIGES